MTRILILGGAGMLGHKLFQVLRLRYPDTWCTIRGKLDEPFYRRISLLQQGQVIEGIDAMDIAGLEARVRALHPDVLINGIGVIKQRDEATSHIPSITINALLPHRLAACASGWGGKVIHFSTDCVFSGNRGQYTEQDFSDAEDVYGKTKYLGEVATKNALTLRTSIIGRELSHFQSLLEWFLRQDGGTVRGFTRAYYSGVTTNYLARLVSDLITEYPAMHGLYQVTSRTIAKHDLLRLLRSAYRLNVDIVPDEGTFCDRSMLGTTFRTLTGYPEPLWPELVADLAADSTPYAEWVGSAVEC